MKAGDLAAILRDRYHHAAKGDVALSIHLFGIEFADQLAGHSLKDICAQADVPVSYQVEINKGMRIAPHVQLKTGRP